MEETNNKKNIGTIFCYAYSSDLEQAYSFYCARYENIKYEEFLNLGIREFSMKLASIPESEPLYKIIKSRTINTAKIKDKEERKYWNELKRINAIPEIYISNEELNYKLKEYLKTNGGMKYANKSN